MIRKIQRDGARIHINISYTHTHTQHYLRRVRLSGTILASESSFRFQAPLLSLDLSSSRGVLYLSLFSELTACLLYFPIQRNRNFDDDSAPSTLAMVIAGSPPAEATSRTTGVPGFASCPYFTQRWCHMICSIAARDTCKISTQQWYFHRETRLNAMKRFCICSL